MSPGDDRIRKLIEALERLQCEIELPPSWYEHRERLGMAPIVASDKRRFRRYYLPAVAAFKFRRSFSALPRRGDWHKIYTKDVSRAGIAFFHSEPLFPRERMTILLPDGSRRAVEITRCRRIREHCYEIGAAFSAVSESDEGD
jgi:hypothetical protein